MGFKEILTLVAMLWQAGPEILKLLSRLAILFGAPSGKTSDITEGAIAKWADMQKIANDAAKVAEGLDFGALSKDDRSQAKFDSVVRTVESAAPAVIGDVIDKGRAETLAQNAWANLEAERIEASSA